MFLVIAWLTSDSSIPVYFVGNKLQGEKKMELNWIDCTDGMNLKQWCPIKNAVQHNKYISYFSNLLLWSILGQRKLYNLIVYEKRTRITSLTNKVKVEAKRGRTTSVLTLKWRAWCNIWLISWILCINGQRDTLGQDWRLPLTATVNFQHNQFMCSSIITICVQQSRQRIWGAMWFLSKKLRPRGRQVQLRHMEFKALCVGLAWDFLQVRLAANYVPLWLLDIFLFPPHATLS